MPVARIPWLMVMLLLAAVLTQGETKSTFGSTHLDMFDTMRRLSLGTKLSHSVALAICQAAGIGIRSSTGQIGCRDPGCTSLEQVRYDTVLGILNFWMESGCPGIVITGGTEAGHAGGTFSHYNGYKLDIALTDCISGYVEENFRHSHTRSDGAKVYVDGRNNEYALESNHWDILYR